MTGRTHLIIPDAHAHFEHNNDRAEWLGKFILDKKIDVVINMGDMWDFPSLSSYDKGKKSFHGRSYKKDLDAGLDFDEKLWYNIRKAKKKMPVRYFLEGNHEFRLKRALDTHLQELDGFMSFKDLDLDRNYDEVIEYDGNTPGTVSIDGVCYAHYFASGVMGRPIGGEHPAYSLITKGFQSCTCSHIHTYDECIRTRADGRHVRGLVAGVYQDYHTGWAGKVNDLWWRGVVVCHNVEDGNYESQQISIDRLKQVYGK